MALEWYFLRVQVGREDTIRQAMIAKPTRIANSQRTDMINKNPLAHMQAVTMDLETAGSTNDRNPIFLSNEEFASKLRSVSFPFSSADSGASVEIYHDDPNTTPAADLRTDVCLPLRS